MMTSIEVNRRVPWITFLFIISVFWIISNDWGISQRIHERRDLRNYSMTVVAEGSQIKRIIVPILGAYGFLSLLQTARKRRVNIGLLGWIVLFFCFWALLSVAWTSSLGLTVRRLVVFGCFALGALGVALRSSARNVAVLICLSCASYLMYSIFCEISLQTFDFGNPDYRFGGTMAANVQGINCALIMLSGLYLGATERKSRWPWWILSAAGLFFLVLTKSRAGFGAAILAAVVYKNVVSVGSQKLRFAYVAGVVGSLLFLLFGDDLISTASSGISLGRDLGDSASLNGRIPLWSECLSYSRVHPIVGYGFNGFWTPQRIGMISSSQRWNIASGHSIYIDVLLDLGVIGLITFVMILLGGIGRCLKGVRKGENAFGFFVGFLVFLAMEGIMESQFLTPGHLAFLGMVVVASIAFGCDRVVPRLRHNR